MSQPTQQGYPQQPYGAPQSPYGAPEQQYGAPAPQPTGSNGFAVAGLIFGIIGGSILGLIFGFLGLSKAKKVGGKGKTMSVIAIVFSVLWLLVQVGVGILIATHTDDIKNAVKATNPGCISVNTSMAGMESKITADSNDLAAFKADIQSIITELNSAATKSTDATATAAIKKYSADYQELLDDLNKGTAPSSDLQTRLVADETAVNTACGATSTS